MRVLVAVLLSLLTGFAGAAQQRINLIDLEGRRFDPFAGANTKAVVFIFVRHDCPVSNRYAPEVQRLIKEFRPKGVDFFLTYPDPASTTEQIRQHLKDYDYQVTALRDPEHSLVAYAGVTVTPEAAVFASGKLVYRGRIDDRYIAFGKTRPSPTVRDLADTLVALLSGARLELRTTSAIGCYINDLKHETQTSPTFNRDIAPIIYKSCAMCHHPGGSGPFSLLSYDDVRPRAKQITEVTASRYMPPWLPEPGYGRFAGERRLDAAEIDLIRKWSEGGALQGDPKDLGPAPHFREGWQLGDPDLIIRMPEVYTLRASGEDVFRNFVIPVPANIGGEARFVRAIEILPGNKRIVHHANIIIDRSGEARRRDAADAEVGFAGMDINIATSSFEPESHFLFWKPGAPEWAEPDGMSWRLDKGTDLVLNMHLQPSGKPEPVQASIGLYFAKQPPVKFPMLLQLERDGAIDIPAGARDYTISDQLRLPVDVDVLGIYPHAHYLGKEIKAWATLPDGERRWLIWIKEWDINWQAVYRYEQPLHLPRGTLISMRYTYDNSPANPRNPSHPPRRVQAGDRSIDEMGHLWIQVLPRPRTGEKGDPRIALQKALMEARLIKYPGDYAANFNLGAALESEGRQAEAIIHYRSALRAKPNDVITLQSLGAALQEIGKTDEAIACYRQVLRIDPDYSDAHYNLGNLLLARGQFAEAISHLKEVTRLVPDDAGAYNSLGSAYGMQGKLDEAISYFERALQIDPKNAEARENLRKARAK